jgi:hypothetical protein
VGLIDPAMIVTVDVVAVDSDGVSQGAVREVHGDCTVVLSKVRRREECR